VKPRITYVICSSPRTGSSWLCRGLSETGVCGDPLEYFHTKLLSKKYVKDWQATHFDEYVERMLAERSTSNGVFGLKLHWEQLRYLVQLAKKMQKYRSMSPGEILTHCLGRPRFIYMSRQNKWRQAISEAIALRTGVWKGNAEERNAQKATPHFDYDLIRQAYLKARRDEVSWRAFFQENNMVPLEIAYEDLAKSYRETIRGICAFLRLPDEGAEPVVSAASMKLSNETNDVWLRNCEEMPDPVYYWMNLLAQIKFFASSTLRSYPSPWPYARI